MVGTSGATTEPPKDTRRASLPADRLGWAACAATGCAFLGLLISWLAGGWTVSLPWAPTLGLRLAFSLDGLGALYSLLATGIGLAREKIILSAKVSERSRRSRLI